MKATLPLLLVAAVYFGLVLIAANKPVTVALKDAKGKDVGNAIISDGPNGNGVVIALDVRDLPQGVHAVHFHSNARCDSPEFATAGDHFNPGNAHHGTKNPESPKPHAGDLPNFSVEPDGTAKVTLEDPLVTLGGGIHALFSNGGTALVIHAMADDLKTDPAGNAGGRIACGTVTRRL